MILSEFKGGDGVYRVYYFKDGPITILYYVLLCLLYSIYIYIYVCVCGCVCVCDDRYY